jgi:hypothetical protein
MTGRVAAEEDSGLELAYSAACEILKIQDQTLANVRSRATQVLSTAALLTSIAAGVGLINLDPKNGATLSSAGAWSILVVMLLVGVLVIYVQWPARGWSFGPSPVKIMERRKTTPGVDDLREYVVDALIKGIDSNDRVLRRRQQAFRWSAGGLLLEVVALVIAVT